MAWQVSSAPEDHPPRNIGDPAPQLAIDEIADAACRKADRYELIGRLGLVLLIIGLGLQFVASVAPR